MITPTKIKSIQAKIQAAIAQIAIDENVNINFGGCRYDSIMYNTKMTVTTKEKSEMATSGFEKLCRSVGFTQNVIGMGFRSDNGQCVITEIKTRNRKYPVIAKCSNGKYYKYSVASIKAKLGGDKLINREANLNKLV